MALKKGRRLSGLTPQSLCGRRCVRRARKFATEHILTKMATGHSISGTKTCLPTAFGCLSKTSPKVGSFCGRPFYSSLYRRLILAFNIVALREIKVVENKHAIGVKNCMWLQALIRWDLWSSKRQSNDTHCTHRFRKSRHDPGGKNRKALDTSLWLRSRQRIKWTT